MRAESGIKGVVWIALGLMLAVTPACSSSNGGDDPVDGGEIFDSTVTDAGDGGGDPDGGDPADGGGDPADGGDGPADGDSPFCVGVGGECATTAECCSNRLCEDDGSGVRRCTDETFCKGTGLACTRASECCSLSCDGTCQGDGSICAPAGDDCTADSECCSNDCDGTCQAIGEHCSPMGERCDTEGFDEGCCSKNCRNFGTEEDEDLRCARASSCGARGEICSDPADCCSGVCIDGRCPTQNEIGGSRFAGEPCQEHSDCSSFLCAANYTGGPKVCQFLGGCRPIGEICTEDWQCCSDILMTSGATCDEPVEGSGCVAHSTVEGLSTCADNLPPVGPAEPGEICLEGDGETVVHDCCFECEQTIVGVWRCAGGGFECPGEDGGVPADGGDCPTCIPDGELCRTSAECCSSICSPFLNEDTGETELRCGPCVETGGLCTTNGDCCSFVCTDGVCGEPDEGDPVCVPLGAGPCTQTSDCCNGDDPNIACLDSVCIWVG
jgi:hypothetical protein